MPSPPSIIAGKSVGSTGYGLMGFTAFYGTPFEVAIPVMKTALENGANFWNAGTFYGPPDRNSLHLLKAYFDAYPGDADKVVLSLKGAYNATTFSAEGTPEGIRASVEESLAVLGGCKSIDLFECARVDPNVPIETSVQTLAELIKEGKIGSYGLSEASATTIRRAYAVFAPAAVEIEMSLFSRHVLVKGGVADTCAELDIPLVAYSPLDRGWLSGNLRKPSDLAPNDHRHHLPRFQPGAFEQNVKLAEHIQAMADKRGVTAAQVAIAWVKQQGALPIPGASKAERVMENCKDLKLTDAELANLATFLSTAVVSGARYPTVFQALLEG